MSRVRVAVVGCGAVTQAVHLPLLARRWDQAEIVAVVDLAPERARAVADRYGVRNAFGGVAELLAAREDGTCQVDAVLLATSGTHAPDIARLSGAGLPVLAEKPLTLSLGEADRLQGAVTAPVRVGYMKEYDPAVATAARRLDGAHVRHVGIEILHPTSATQLAYARLLPPAAVDPDALGTVRAAERSALDEALGTGLEESHRRLYADVVVGSLVHQIALLRHLGLAVEEVDDAEHWGADAVQPGSLRVSGRLHGGARLDLGWHFLPGHTDYRETYRLQHEEGTVELLFGIPYLLNAPTVLTDVTAAPGGGQSRAEHRWNQQEAFEIELGRFLAAVRDDRAAGADGHSGLPEARADLQVAQAVLGALARRHGWTVGGETAVGSRSPRRATAVG